MPLSKHFGGHGKEVMKKMKSKYGDKKGESVFYATDNKNKMDTGPSDKFKKKHRLSKEK